MYEKSLETLRRQKLVPVVKLERVQDALPLGETLCEAGLPIAEVTFRTDAAQEAIEKLTKEFPGMTVGAGTVVNKEQAKRAFAAGAQFLVSPGVNREVIEYALGQNCPVYPGTCTPSEIMTALEYGLPVVKFFPANQYGGLKTIQALGSVFSQLQFMPTGGIHVGNLLEYLEDPRVIACGGSWMVKDSLIRQGDFQRVGQLTREAVKLIQEQNGK